MDSRQHLEMAIGAPVQAGNSDCLATKYKTLVAGTRDQGKCREMNRTEPLPSELTALQQRSREES